MVRLAGHKSLPQGIVAAVAHGMHLAVELNIAVHSNMMIAERLSMM